MTKKKKETNEFIYAQRTEIPIANTSLFFFVFLFFRRIRIFHATLPSVTVSSIKIPLIWFFFFFSIPYRQDLFTFKNGNFYSTLFLINVNLSKGVITDLYSVTEFNYLDAAFVDLFAYLWGFKICMYPHRIFKLNI